MTFDIKSGLKYLILLLCSTVFINEGEAVMQKKTELGSSSDFTNIEANIRSHLYSNPEQANEYAVKYLDGALKYDVDSLEAKAYYFLGVVNYFLSKYHLSSGYYKKALDRPYAASQPAFAEKCWNNIGVNYEILNMYPQALDAYKKSLGMAERLGDSTSIVQTWINIGLLDIMSGNIIRGIQLTERAYVYFLGTRDTLNMALCLQNLGKGWMDHGEFKKALDYDMKSLALYQNQGNLFGIANLQFNIASNVFQQGLLDQCEAYLRESEALAVTHGFEKVRSSAFELWAKLETQRGNYKKAINYWKAAAALHNKMDMPERLADAYLNLASLYTKMGDKEAHDETINAYRNEFQELQSRVALSRYDELMALYEHEKNVKIIEGQAAEIKSFRKRILITTIVAVVLLLKLAIILWLYFQMRKYLRSLYQSNKAQINMKLPDIPTSTGSNSEHVRLAELYNKIIQLMEDAQIFKRSDLSIAMLSEELATNDKYVSQAINKFGNNNFNGFVNSFRVNEARKLMLKEGHRLLIKDIAEKSGFSNLNTFNKKFKEVTGLTPKMFIEMSLEEKLNGHLTE
jgi:AraC-like DNA-binding protein